MKLKGYELAFLGSLTKKVTEGPDDDAKIKRQEDGTLIVTSKTLSEYYEVDSVTIVSSDEVIANCTDGTTKNIVATTTTTVAGVAIDLGNLSGPIANLLDALFGGEKDAEEKPEKEPAAA